MKTMNLQDLKVKSFTTSLNAEKIDTVKGGGRSAKKTFYQLCTAPSVYNESCDSSQEEICK